MWSVPQHKTFHFPGASSSSPLLTDILCPSCLNPWTNCRSPESYLQVASAKATKPQGFSVKCRWSQPIAFWVWCDASPTLHLAMLHCHSVPPCGGPVVASLSPPTPSSTFQPVGPSWKTCPDTGTCSDLRPVPPAFWAMAVASF
jgi:hypothetical protein